MNLKIGRLKIQIERWKSGLFIGVWVPWRKPWAPLVYFHVDHGRVCEWSAPNL